MSDSRPAPDAPVVAMFVRNQFRHDARVVREATTLIEHGFAVTVFAVTLDEAEEARNPDWQGPIRVVRVTLPTIVQRFIQLLMRA
ncbi:MAG TPA: hypothetical protein VM600_00020 [Actinomycetota bacterium]|nr:hypothetical protein [Actinomycetota bacterium]